MESIDYFELTQTVTVGQAKKWISLKDEESKERLITLIYHLFNNRYIKHIKFADSGFLKMAVGCFMIETLEAFKQGIEDTTGKSRKMFEDFFNSEQEYFPEFKQISGDFYKSVRCGILHQAETTDTWRILQKNDLLNLSERTINASKFIEALERSLDRYVRLLRINDFDSDTWKNAIKKMAAIIKNCDVRNL